MPPSRLEIVGDGYDHTRKIRDCSCHTADQPGVMPGRDRNSRWPDAHHIIHWADGGTIDLNNLVLLCRYQHTGPPRANLRAGPTRTHPTDHHPTTNIGVDPSPPPRRSRVTLKRSFSFTPRPARSTVLTGSIMRLELGTHMCRYRRFGDRIVGVSRSVWPVWRH